MKIYDSLSSELSEWALKQPVFFVATAPTYGLHVNVSPKGIPSDSLAILSPNRVAYVDRTGSGCETIAHLQENGRATIMFMSFGAAPRILRLYCRKAEVSEWDADRERFFALLSTMGFTGRRPEGARAVYVLDIFKVTTSCGYAVPMVRRDVLSKILPAAEGGEGGGGDAVADPELAVFEDRHTLDVWAAKREKEGSQLDYRANNNSESLDGMPGLTSARRHAGRWLLLEDLKAVAGRVSAQREGLVAGALLALLAWSIVTQVQAWSQSERGQA